MHQQSIAQHNLPSLSQSSQSSIQTTVTQFSEVSLVQDKVNTLKLFSSIFLNISDITLFVQTINVRIIDFILGIYCMYYILYEYHKI